MLYFTLLPRRFPWTDFHRICNECSPRRHNKSWQIVRQSVQWYRFYRGSKFPIFPIGNWRCRYNSAALPRSLWLRYILGNKQDLESQMQSFSSNLKKNIFTFEFRIFFRSDRLNEMNFQDPVFQVWGAIFGGSWYLVGWDTQKAPFILYAFHRCHWFARKLFLYM